MSPGDLAQANKLAPYALTDPAVRRQLEQCKDGAFNSFNLFDWIIPSAHAAGACTIQTSDGPITMSTANALNCWVTVRDTLAIRGALAAASFALLTGAVLVATTERLGEDIDTTKTLTDGTVIHLTGSGDERTRFVEITTADGNKVSLTLEAGYDKQLILTGGTVNGGGMPPASLQQTLEALQAGGMANVVLNEDAGKTKNPDHTYHPKPTSPEEITGFPGLKPAKPLGGRPRWTDNKGKIYEWDFENGTLEVYDKTGKKHLGEFDPKTGEQTKPSKPGRTTPT